MHPISMTGLAVAIDGSCALEVQSIFVMPATRSIEAVTRGLYGHMSLEPLAYRDLATVAPRIPQGVLCVISELYFHELATLVPTVKAERITADADYEGVGVRFVGGQLGKARVVMQIDIGFGDVVAPGAETPTFPTLLDFRPREIAGYPRDTAP